MVEGDLPSSGAPELTTARLRLSAHGAGDLGDCIALWSDPAVVRFIGGRPFSDDEVWSRIVRYVGQWANLHYGFWAIREAETGRFVGEIGFGDFGRGLEPPFGDAPECGWALAPWAQGRGMAAEALVRVLAWGDERFPPSPGTVCMIHPDNTASIRLAERHGFQEYTRTVYRESPTILYQRRVDADGPPLIES